MTRTRSQYACTDCGWTTTKWVGRCGECQTWGSVAESSPAKARLAVSVVPASAARPIALVPLDDSRTRPTGVGELDRVLGGGLIPGSAVLLCLLYTSDAADDLLCVA